MKKYDVAVIGAGVIGTSVAYHLQKEGYKVLIIDREDVAAGTSSHCDSVALIADKQPGIDTEQGYASIQRFLELRDELDFDFEFHQRGILHVCECDAELVAAKRYVDAQVADGYDMKMLDRQEIYDYEPLLAKDLLGGFWSSEDCTLNPYKLCFGYIHKAKQLGMDLMAFTEVRNIKRDADGAVTGLITSNGEISAERIVNCAGVWAPFIGKMVGVEIPIEPRKGICMVAERGNPVVHQKVHEFGYMMSKFDDIEFERKVSERVARLNVAMVIEPTDAMNFILGGNRNFSGFDIRSEIEVMQAVAERGIRYFPTLKEINCIRTYCGVRPFVIDHLPIVSPVDGVPGFFIAAGHEGDGISLSAITGKMVAQMIKGENTDFDITKLRFSRFTKA